MMIRQFTVCGVVLLLTSSMLNADDAAPVHEGASVAKVAAERFFRQHDQNQDGRLSPEEFPKRLQGLFSQIDVNRDRQITLSEDIAYRERRRQRGNRARPDQRQLPENVAALRDLEYARVGGKSLRLDLYLPRDAKGKRPLVVWVHGGAWKQGDKGRCPALRLVTRGYAVASLNYRFSQEAIFPAQIEDCKAAIRWLRSRAQQHQLDPERIGVWGSSAGGHLVALLGTSGDVAALQGSAGDLQQSSRVQCVVDYFGPTDFLQMDAHALANAPFKHNAASSPESQLVGGPITDVPEKVAAANPITYVSKDDPPFLIVHGDRDPLVPHHQSELLADALKQAGVQFKLHTVQGGGHGFGNRPELDRLVDQFLDRHLRASVGGAAEEKAANN